jgi:NADPH-dependent glutamate synthase beta subunit-like oxidoreductase/formate hydrogenlyase subunit 6/NADH:ubiquinone oxidoreductase subunit I
MIKGLVVTLKNLVKRPVTVQYPEQRLNVSRRERGTVLAWSMDKCTGCYTCQQACPHKCISIETSIDGQKYDATVPCVQRCPAHVDAARYIRCIADGKPEEAVAVIREKLPLPSICAYICAHPCENNCNRGDIDEPISIRKLKRYAVDHDNGLWKTNVKQLPPSGKKVAIIGAGPAGLTVAYYLARKGHAATVLEALPATGGMMKVGIPDYRLPPSILEGDIKEIENIGVVIKTDVKIESVDNLLNEGFNAVFVGVGAHQAMALGVQGDTEDGVLGGVDFLREVNLGRHSELGKRVAVIGGGNTAIDCARTAVREGAEEVSLIYRRTRAEMPAAPEEIEEAVDEGVKLVFLAAPSKVFRQDGKLMLECIRMKLGAEDSSGRRKPEQIKGSEYAVELDHIISAVSQSPIVPKSFALSTDRSSRLIVDSETLSTNKAGVYAGGDAVLGPATVIECIAQGRIAASSIDKYLGGDGNIQEVLATPETSIKRDGAPREGFRPHNSTISHDKRLNTFEGVEISWNKEEAESECARCLRCDMQYKPEKWELKGGQCIYCGLCVEACPFDALFMGTEYERSSYRLSDQTLQKEELLTPQKQQASGYYHPEIARTLPEQTLCIEKIKGKKK